MKSLRSRLILGFSLVSVIPLALAMFLLTERIERMVRTEAAGRLDAALGTLQAEVESDGRRIAEKLAILARDPQLRRLYLLKPSGSRDLSEFLAERQFLLGLDFLTVMDTTGAVVAEGAAAEGGAGLALAASAPIRYQSEIAGLVHGGLTFDSAFLSRLGRANGMQLVLRDSAGRIVAATLEGAPEAGRPPGPSVERLHVAGRSYLSQSFPLSIGSAPGATITGLIPAEAADRTVATIEITSALLGALALGLAVFLGILWSAQVSRPVEQLAHYSHKLARGDWSEPLHLHSVREIETLVSALEQMRADLTAYRERLLTSERQAAWSEMARKVAHEIKNPLTPIAVSVADLRRSYEQQRADFPEILDQAVRTIADEVESLKRLLSEFSEFARFPAPRPAPCLISGILADLETLYGREVAAGRLAFERPGREIEFSADAGQVRQALVNLIHNGLDAVADGGSVTVSAAEGPGVVTIAVSDTGPGLSAEQRARLFTPGFTTKARGSGLGLTIVERIVNDHGGTISVDSGAGRGTVFRIRLPLAART